MARVKILKNPVNPAHFILLEVLGHVYVSPQYLRRPAAINHTPSSAPREYSCVFTGISGACGIFDTRHGNPLRMGVFNQQGSGESVQSKRNVKENSHETYIDLHRRDRGAAARHGVGRQRRRPGLDLRLAAHDPAGAQRV